MNLLKKLEIDNLFSKILRSLKILSRVQESNALRLLNFWILAPLVMAMRYDFCITCEKLGIL